jgi:hypothetical protein
VFPGPMPKPRAGDSCARSSDAGSVSSTAISVDRVHLIESDPKIGVLVDGFDRLLSYAYAAGTELTFIVPR